MRRPFLAALAALLAAACTSPGRDAAAPVAISVLAINDFHGNLMPPAGGISIADPNDPSKKIAVAAGGSEYMGTLIRQLRAKNRNTIFVAAGDLIGASPLQSALFHDEPTVESLALMGLEVSAVGNHEFEKGPQELLRIQNGGCHPVDGCRGPHPFTGAKYQYLAANTIVTATGKTILPPYSVKRFDGIPVAFIGLTLKGTPAVITPSGTAGLEFRDEAETINALVPKLRAQGIEAIVVLIHEGGEPTGGYNECPGISGPIVDIVGKLDKAVDVVVSGHTHAAYNCRIDGRLVTSAHRFGTLVTDIELRLDRKTRDVVSAKAENLIVRNDGVLKDEEQTKLLATYEPLVAPLENRVVGTTLVPLTRDQNAAGELILGDLLADGELAATKPADKGGAQIAFMHAGGIRSEIVKRPNGTVTFADLFAVQPFGNLVIMLTVTGAQIKTALEEQWFNESDPRILQISEGFSYAWDAKRPRGDRVIPGSMILNGKSVVPSERYRIAVPDFLADGGDNFDEFKNGTDRVIELPNIDATEMFVHEHSPIGARPLDRIHRMN